MDRSQRRHGLGLRGQIVLALLLAFAVSFALLGLAAVRLTERARAIDRFRSGEAIALGIASAIDASGADDDATLERIGRDVVGTAGITGISVERPGRGTFTHGRDATGSEIEASLTSGGRIFVRVAAPTDGPDPVAQLFLMYVAITAGAILLLAYVALTYLIVRPVEKLTQAAERFAGGAPNVQVPVTGAAEVARAAVAFNDMAGQLRAERAALEARLAELEKTTAELRSTQQSLLRSEKLASVGRLAAGVAHEIGNPLAAILGLIELLRQGGLEPAEQEEFLRRAQAETERIQKIIRGLLDFARQGPTPAAASDATADLREVVEDAVRLVAPQKDLRNVDIERRLADDTPRVKGSPDELTQLVLNLLLNAADAIKKDGSIRLEVSPDDSGRTVSLVVADSGPGIAPEVVGKLFEPFVTTKPPGEGTGLGLAVCHTIVDRLGGTITASNPPEGGARFEVHLPVSASRS